MKHTLCWTLCLILLTVGCSRSAVRTARPNPTAYGAAITEVSGGKQVAAAGFTLDQPVVVQVNDAQGSGVTGAYVEMLGPSGVTFDPVSGLTDSSGQFTSKVSLGAVAGRYQLRAVTRDRSGKPIEVKLEEIALDYQQVLGRQLSQQYCVRCHDPESSAERVSNMDNLTTKPHTFNDGDTLNKIADADLIALITHGGRALNKSAEMPPYGNTLSQTDIQALMAYIRAVADPPFSTKGVTYAKN